MDSTEQAIGRLIIDLAELPEVSCWRTAKGNRNHELYRRLYRRFVGPIPDGLELDHLCMNASCCNPWHLEPVTHLTNMQRSAAGDSHYARRRPGCMPRGEKHSRAKLTTEQVREIRLRRQAGEAGNRLADEFGVEQRTIYRIERREIWAHVD